MFKKMYEKIDAISGKMNGLYGKMDIIHGMHNNYCSDMQSIQILLNHMPEINSMKKTIESQQRTIEQLTNALKDKYEHGLFVVSEDGKKPMVIKNGKELTCELVTYVDISWSRGEAPCITVEQNA